jgi:hypothetical protein
MKEKTIYLKKIFENGGHSKEVGEAALGICFPLKLHSSYPMHPVPHFL